MSNSDLCEHCGSYWDYHDYEHLARTCYPLQIEKLQAKLNQAEGVIMMRDATIEQMIDMRDEPPTRTWTSARPTKEGWYWYQEGNGPVMTFISRGLQLAFLMPLTINAKTSHPNWSVRTLEYMDGQWCPLDSPPHMEAEQ